MCNENHEIDIKLTASIKSIVFKRLIARNQIMHATL